MSLKSRLKDRKTLMQIGLICLILGNATHFLVRPTGSFARNLVDGVFGLLIGLSIGLLLLSLRRTES
jgi:hypothetical protein